MWNPERASKNSTSLKKAIKALRKLNERLSHLTSK